MARRLELADLEWREQAALRRDLLRGLRSPNAVDAALAVRTAVDMLHRQWIDATALALWAALALALSLTWGETAPRFLLATSVVWGVAGLVRRRGALRRGLQANLEVVAGCTFDGPPSEEDAARLLRIIEQERWLRGGFRDQAPPSAPAG